VSDYKVPIAEEHNHCGTSSCVVLDIGRPEGDLEWFSRRTKLPSSETVRLDRNGSETGFSLFATHTIVCSGILLYQMPMYHLLLDVSAANAK
jgi:hypothetical protein